MSFINLEQLDQENQLIDYVNSFEEVLESLETTWKELHSPQMCFVTDSNIEKYYKFNDRFPQSNQFVLPPGEGAKTLQFATELADYLFQKKFSRQDLLIAVGGGVVTDLVGFVASIYMRGIKFILIPTSLLGMADASVGGKTGVNNNFGKNQMGVINDPYKIKICTNFLQSLDKRNFLNGIAEIIKISGCFDKKLFEKLESYDYQYLMHHSNDLLSILKSSINLKLNIVLEDKYEQNIRKILNYGHTFGHAIEFSSQGQLLHGECVAIGMVLANQLAKELGIDTSQYDNRIIKLLKKYELPTQIPNFINIQDVLKYLQFDKKIIKNEINFVFITDIGKCKYNTHPVKIENIKKILFNQCEIICQEIKPSKSIHGSKSITNRVLLLSSLAEGISQIGNYSDSDDTKAMLNCLQELRLCEIQSHSKHILNLEGCQGVLCHKTYFKIDVKESGTCARFLLPLAALIGNVTIVGSERIYERPIQQMIQSLHLQVRYLNKEGQLPFEVISAKFDKHIQIQSKQSSQFVSGLLMSAPYFPNEETIIEIIDQDEEIVSESYIDMTIQLMNIYGIQVKRLSKSKFVVPKGIYKCQQFDVEPDATALSYDLLHIGLNGGSLETKKISKLQGDTTFLDMIESMGMQIVREQSFIKVIKNQELKPKTIQTNSDTFISLALLMASIEGESKITGIVNQRLKECDRIEAVAYNLNQLGIVCLQDSDSLTIRGKKLQKYDGYRKDVYVKTYGDHRIAMAFSILGGHFEKIKYQYRIIIDNKNCVNKTFPDFYNHIQSLGLQQQSPSITQEEKFLQHYQYFKEPLFIIGMRGAGKSTLSKYICEQLGFQYISVDNLISNNINEYIQQNGWKEFRNKEKEIFIQILLNHQYNVVIDCGGGIIEDEQIQQLLCGKNVIWIEKQIDELIEDLQKENRPNIGDIKSIYDKRKIIYKKISSFTFTIPSRTYIQNISKNYDLNRYYIKVKEFYLNFIKKILYLCPPKNKIYVNNTNFACIFYNELQLLDQQQIHFINRNHNLLEIRMDNYPSLEELKQTISNLKYFLTIPIIFTLRSKNQGGYFEQTNYVQLINEWQTCFIGDYFDIELEYFNNINIDDHYSNSIILSEHIFHKSSKLQIVECIDKMKYLAELNHSTICLLKLAIHQDAYPPQLVYQEISKLFNGMKYIIPNLVVSMGPNVMLYRTLNKFMVPLSCLTPTAIGQCNIQQLRSIQGLTNFNQSQNYHIFGTDLSLSKSDILHQQYFDLLNQEHNKFYTKISIQNFEQAQPYIDSSNFQGASITMPFKQDVQKYLNEQSIEAQMIGAVNCIIRYQNYLLGFNTDWWGIFWPIFKRCNKAIEKCLIFGNGGTAKTAIFVANKLLKAQVTIYGRNPQKVEQLAKIEKVDFMRQAEKNHKFDLIISTIPPGAELEICEEWFIDDPIIFVANHGDDQLLLRKNSISGKEMFEAQAISQIELFNGKTI